MKTVQQKYSSHKQGKLKRILIRAVDESLSSLGDSAKQAIYYHLEKSFNLRKTDIPEKIEVFSNAIESIFGEGAKLLEIQIMKRLHEKAGSELIHTTIESELFFADYVRYKLHAFNNS